MITKIKKFLGKLRIFKRIRMLTIYVKDIESSLKEFKAENYDLKGMLITRRHTIKDLKDNLTKTVNDLNLLAEKKKKGEIFISQLIKRRDEFLERIQSKTYIDINSMADYKFFLSEPFIKEHYTPYKYDKDEIDGSSAIRGLDKVLDVVNRKDKVDEMPLP